MMITLIVLLIRIFHRLWQFSISHTHTEIFTHIYSSQPLIKTYYNFILTESRKKNNENVESDEKIKNYCVFAILKLNKETPFFWSKQNS